MYWPKDVFYWRDGGINYASIPFTWLLEKARDFIFSRSGQWMVGGPAVNIMPEYFLGLDNVKPAFSFDGILQKINPLATRTTTGCNRRCEWCGIGQRLIEGDFVELETWPDNPIICDNNLLFASEQHLQKVFSKLRWWGWADFNQGLDCRLVTPEIAKEIASIGKPVVRLALDQMENINEWCAAVDRFMAFGVPKSRISCYVMIGFSGYPQSDVKRIQFAKRYLDKLSNICVMWFHELRTLKPNVTTEKQKALGWTDKKRINVMRWAYGREELQKGL